MPLIVRQREAGRYDVLCGAVRVGVILRPANQATAWQWHINGVANMPPDMESGGWADSLDDAKRSFAANWRKWIDAARLTEAANIERKSELEPEEKAVAEGAPKTRRVEGKRARKFRNPS
jgi:hypothetical protein